MNDAATDRRTGRKKLVQKVGSIVKRIDKSQI